MVYKVLVDTDPGVDDALALFYAHLSKGIKIEAITTAIGNGPVVQHSRNASKLVALMEKYKPANIPVIEGLDKPLESSEVWTNNGDGFPVFGDDLLGATSLFDAIQGPKVLSDAPAYIAEKVGNGSVDTIFCIAALTNLAAAYMKFPQKMSRLKRLVIMGGTINEPGNGSTYAEANFHTDPLAAAYIFGEASIPNETVLMPLDVANHALLKFSDLEKIHNKGIGYVVREISQIYIHFYMGLEPHNFEGGAMNDPLVPVYLLHPEIFQFNHACLRVIPKGEMAGKCEIINAAANVYIAMKIDSMKLMDHFITTINAYSN